MIHVCDPLYRLNKEPRLLYFLSDGVPMLVMVDFTLKESSNRFLSATPLQHHCGNYCQPARSHYIIISPALCQGCTDPPEEAFTNSAS